MKNHLIAMFFMLFGLLLITFSGQQTSAIKGNARDSCSSRRPVCLNCETLINCYDYDNPTYADIDCTYCGMVCGEAGEVAGCYASYDGVRYDINNNTISNSNCLCRSDDGLDLHLTNGYYADPYNSSCYVNCSNGVPSYRTCSEGEFFDSILQTCVDGQPCPEGMIEPMENPLSCNTYFECPTGHEVACDPTSYIFDERIGACIDPTVGPECLGSTPGEMFQHNDACYISLSCSGAVPPVLVGSTCCPRGEYFNENTATCDPITYLQEATCNVSLCMQEYYEQTYCNQCEGAGNYATRDICSHYYFECESDGMGGYQPVLAECGTYYSIFDPVDNSCRREIDVAECQPAKDQKGKSQ